jgi:hypothetical protein
MCSQQITGVEPVQKSVLKSQHGRAWKASTSELFETYF